MHMLQCIFSIGSDTSHIFSLLIHGANHHHLVPFMTMVSCLTTDGPVWTVCTIVHTIAEAMSALQARNTAAGLLQTSSGMRVFGPHVVIHMHEAQPFEHCAAVTFGACSYHSCIRCSYILHT